MGGDCLNYGCVPSKALIKSAKVVHQMRHAANYGLQGTQPTFSFKAVMQRVHAVIAAIEPHDSIERANWLLWVAHNLERVADRVTNICERTVFIATGEMGEIKSSNDEFWQK